LKILMICPLTNRSGGSVIFWEICCGLNKLGHEVVYVERHFSGDKKKSFGSVRCIRSKEFSRFAPINILLSLAHNIIVSLFVKCDLVFSLKALPNSCIPAMIKKLFGSRAVLHMDDLDYEFYKAGMIKKLLLFCYRFFPKHFHMITLGSLKLLDYMKKDMPLCEEKLVHLRQGVDIALFNKAEYDSGLKSRLGFDGYKIAAYIASLGITSDYEQIADLFIKIASAVKDVKFLIIGGGMYVERFKEKLYEAGLGEQAVFTGYVPHGEIPLYLNLAQVGINYMDEDKANSFRVPIKVKEYLAAGLPVVCNDVGDYEILKDHINIAADEDQFVSMVLKLLENGYGRDEREIRFMEDNYSWSKIIQDFNSNINLFVNPAVT